MMSLLFARFLHSLNCKSERTLYSVMQCFFNLDGTSEHVLNIVLARLSGV